MWYGVHCGRYSTSTAVGMVRGGAKIVDFCTCFHHSDVIESILKARNADETTAVSYTHLTLPTKRIV